MTDPISIVAAFWRAGGGAETRVRAYMTMKIEILSAVIGILTLLWVIAAQWKSERDRIRLEIVNMPGCGRDNEWCTKSDHEIIQMLRNHPNNSETDRDNFHANALKRCLYNRIVSRSFLKSLFQ